MPRNRTQKDSPMKIEKLPFQTRQQQVSPAFWVPSLEAAKATLPIFGGTAPTTGSEESSEESKSTTKSKSESSGGSAGGDNPAEQLSPEQISELVKQVSTLTETSKTLENELNGYKQKEDDARRASMGREEAQQEELTKAHETIAAMDEVIRYVALVNAIQNNGDKIEFHDVNFVLSKLDPNSFDLEVDLEHKRASVNGVEGELKRIAKDFDWAVKKNSVPGTEQRGPGRPRSSGAPPAPPTVNQSGATRRAALEEKWPVITHGRSRSSV